MEKHTFNIHIGQLADIETPVNYILMSREGQQHLTQEYDDLTFEIDYPLELEKVRVNIKKARSLADILVPIAKAYKHVVYQEPEKHGIWGHDLDDLFFEGIVINDDGTTELHVGS
jgi:hypothetical protein